MITGDTSFGNERLITTYVVMSETCYLLLKQVGVVRSKNLFKIMH